MSAPLAAIIERVGKTLALEERQGHRNRAVIGGVTRFAVEQLRPLRGRLPTNDADQRLARVADLLRDYAALDPAARGPRLAAALDELRALYRLLRQLGDNEMGNVEYGVRQKTAARRKPAAEPTIRTVRAETGVLVVKNPPPPARPPAPPQAAAQHSAPRIPHSALV